MARPSGTGAAREVEELSARVRVRGRSAVRQQFDWLEGDRTGQTLTIALVDVGQPEVAPEDEPEAEYRVERTADRDLPAAPVRRRPRPLGAGGEHAPCRR